MGWMRTLSKAKADEAHVFLAPLIAMGMKPSHAMTGAILVVAADKSKVLFQATDNFSGGDYHVEQALLAKLFDWTADRGHPFSLPAGCTVYLYVYDSPCTGCVDRLRTIRFPAGWGRNLGNVRWKLGFSKYYLLPKKKGHASAVAAQQAYTNDLEPAGWRVKQVA